jgi:ferredoxin-thioredoxin reductase catalytic subunit
MEDIESKIFAWAKEYAEKEGLKINSDQGIMVQAINIHRNLDIQKKGTCRCGLFMK